MLSLPDRTAAFCEILKAKRELSQLKAKHEERTQVWILMYFWKCKGYQEASVNTTSIDSIMMDIAK